MKIADKTSDIYETIFFHTYRTLFPSPWSPLPQEILRVAWLMSQPTPYQITHAWRSYREKKTLKNTSWRLIDCKYVLQRMPCAMHDYKYELDKEVLWWWWWLWRWKWRRLGFIDGEDDEGVLAADDALPVLILVTFRWGPLYESCTSGRCTSVSTLCTGAPTSYFALFLQIRLPLIPSSSILLSFHLHTWFLLF